MELGLAMHTGISNYVYSNVYMKICLDDMYMIGHTVWYICNFEDVVPSGFSPMCSLT